MTTFKWLSGARETDGNDFSFGSGLVRHFVAEPQIDTDQ